MCELPENSQTGSAGGTQSISPECHSRIQVQPGIFPLDLLRKMTFLTFQTNPHSSAYGLLRARCPSASQTIRSGPERQRQHHSVHRHHHASTQLMLVTETAPNLRTWHAPQRACIRINQPLEMVRDEPGTGRVIYSYTRHLGRVPSPQVGSGLGYKLKLC